MAKKLNKSSLLWFIRSRPYTTVAELRRRFTLEAESMEAVKLQNYTYYVGLPARPAALLGQLIQEGRVGIEPAIDVRAHVVEGVFPLDLREYRERITADRAARNGGQAQPLADDAVDEVDGEEADEE